MKAKAPTLRNGPKAIGSLRDLFAEKNRDKANTKPVSAAISKTGLKAVIPNHAPIAASNLKSPYPIASLFFKILYSQKSPQRDRYPHTAPSIASIIGVISKKY